MITQKENGVERGLNQDIAVVHRFMYQVRYKCILVPQGTSKKICTTVLLKIWL